jgi:16S rRNA (cytidine1402-2'-O)-methyltransferase
LGAGRIGTGVAGRLGAGVATLGDCRGGDAVVTWVPAQPATTRRANRLGVRRERTRHLTGSAEGGSPTPARDREEGAAAAGETGREGQLAPGLYLVATPIGNLGDITRRAETVLAAADVVVCEDRRVTSRLLRHLGLSRPLGLYHEHNAEAARPELLARLAAGGTVALVSDAGTPAVSDPGYKLVRDALRQGSRVHPVPGPSAALAALVASGLPTDRFLFQGFLPPKSAARRRVLEELAPVRATLLLFEAPHRLAETLADCAAVLGDRPAVVARELTKLYEELRPGTLRDLAGSYAAESPPKGEIVVVVGPPEAGDLVEDDATVDALLAAALREKKPRLAASEVAAATGRSANELYKRALALSARECP